MVVQFEVLMEININLTHADLLLLLPQRMNGAKTRIREGPRTEVHHRLVPKGASCGKRAPGFLSKQDGLLQDDVLFIVVILAVVTEIGKF